jgi:hypothetical protein
MLVVMRRMDSRCHWKRDLTEPLALIHGSSNRKEHIWEILNGQALVIENVITKMTQGCELGRL